MMGLINTLNQYVNAILLWTMSNL